MTTEEQNNAMKCKYFFNWNKKIPRRMTLNYRFELLRKNVLRL